MKRYEDFNKMCGGNETAEEQAIGMTLVKVGEEHEIDIDTDKYMKHFRLYLNWLNEEVE